MVDQSRNIYLENQSEEMVDVLLNECALVGVDDLKKHVGFVDVFKMLYGCFLLQTLFPIIKKHADLRTPIDLS